MNVQNRTRKIVLLGLLIAIMAMLAFIPGIGTIRFGTFTLALMHIPMAIGAAMLGPIAGLVLGTAFGILSLLLALTQGATPFDLVFLNPFVSVLPRMLAGLGSGLIFYALKKAGKPLVGAGLCGAAAALLNTIFVLGTIWIIDPAAMFGTSEVTTAVIRAVMVPVLLTNALPETLVSVLVTLGVYKAAGKYFV